MINVQTDNTGRRLRDFFLFGVTSATGVGQVQFEADQGPKNLGTPLVSISSAWDKHFELFAEYGFNPGAMTFFAGDLTIRF